MKSQLALFLLAAHPATAAMVSFEGSVTGTIVFLSAGPRIENAASGVAELFPFGTGEYTKHGYLDFGDLNPDGSGPGQDGGIVFSHEYTLSGGTGSFAGASGPASHAPVRTFLTDPAFRFQITGVVSGPTVQAIPEPHRAVRMLAAFGLFACTARDQRRRQSADVRS